MDEIKLSIVPGPVGYRLRLLGNSENFDAHFLRLRKALGPPWNNDHKLAMAAAIATAHRET